jgi:hypothetical protein
MAHAEQASLRRPFGRYENVQPKSRIGGMRHFPRSAPTAHTNCHVNPAAAASFSGPSLWLMRSKLRYADLLAATRTKSDLGTYSTSTVAYQGSFCVQPKSRIGGMRHFPRSAPTAHTNCHVFTPEECSRSVYTVCKLVPSGDRAAAESA